MVCSQAVERLVQCANSGCPSEKERQIVLNCTRLLTRILPYIFEDADWRGFFWSTIPGTKKSGVRHVAWESWHSDSLPFFGLFKGLSVILKLKEELNNIFWIF